MIELGVAVIPGESEDLRTDRENDKGDPRVPGEHSRAVGDQDRNLGRPEVEGGEVSAHVDLSGVALRGEGEFLESPAVGGDLVGVLLTVAVECHDGLVTGDPGDRGGPGPVCRVVDGIHTTGMPLRRNDRGGVLPAATRFLSRIAGYLDSVFSQSQP